MPDRATGAVSSATPPSPTSSGPRAARPRDGLGRFLADGEAGVAPVPQDLLLDSEQTLRRAQELIDADCPFQAHEVLEARWKTGPEAEREYWQGLAQAAVALTHLRRGNPPGARALADRAAGHLAGLPAMPQGADTAAVCRQLADIGGGCDRGLRIAVTP